MLSFLRKKENVKKIMWGLAIIIIPAFVLWGAGSASRSRDLPKYAGIIFGKKITFPQYQGAYSACRSEAVLTYGEELKNMAKFLDLEGAAWERLILLYQARKEKIAVTNEEVINLIRRMPVFQQDSRFSKKVYDVLLSYSLRTNPREFEEQLRDSLKIAKLNNKVIDKVTVTDDDIARAYQSEREKAAASYIFIDPKKFSEQVHPAYEELQAYYQGRKEAFKKPQQVNAQYIGLYLEQENSQVDVSDEEIQNYYRENLEEFSQKGKDEQELISPLEEARAQIREKLAEQKLKKILEDKIWQISEELTDDPQGLEQVAKNYQLEIKETGFFVPQQVIPEIGLSYEFSDAAFSLKAGEFSDVIETPKGYFILKVIEKKDAFIPELIDLKQNVEKAYIEQKSWELAKAYGRDLVLQIKKLMDEAKLTFNQAAQNLSLEAKETAEFSRIGYIPEIGQSVEFSRAAFALKAGEASDLVRIPNGYCILSLKSIIPADLEKLAEEKEEFAKKVLAKKRQIIYQVWLNQLKQQAALKNNISNLPQP